MLENGKYSNATFGVIFKHCDELEAYLVGQVHPPIEVKTFDYATWRSVKVLQAAHGCQVGKTTAVLGNFYQPLSGNWYPRVTEIVISCQWKKNVMAFIYCLTLPFHQIESWLQCTYHWQGHTKIKNRI